MHCLIVDDEALAREGLRLLLQRIDPLASVDLSADAASAILKTSADAYDLIVVDLGLKGGGDGLALIEAIKAAPGPSQATPILVVSGRDDPMTIKEVFRRGAHSFLSKGSIDQSEIATAIDTIRAGQVYMSRKVWGYLEAPDDESRATARLYNALDTFTGRQLEVARLIYAGWPYQQMADSLGLKMGGVRRHIDTIFAKLGVRNRGAFMALLARAKIDLGRPRADHASAS